MADLATSQSSLFRPRVLFANATGDVGGAEQVVLSLADLLPKLGIDVSYALLRPGPLVAVLQKRGANVHVFPEDFRYRDIGSVRRCISWLTACIRSTNADILHSNLTAHFIGGWAARKAHVPELWHLHDYPFHFDPVHTINRLISADFYVFTTDFLKSGEASLARRPHAVVKPNCIDVEKLQAAPTRPDVWQRLNIHPQSYFLTVARLQEHKGHVHLIDAALLLHQLYPEIKFLIVGGAKGTKQESYLSRLREQVANAGLQETVVFSGFIPDEDMATLFRGAIALAHPALTEGYGLVLLEAMAHHLPIIAAAASGPAEIIQHRKNGLLVPVADSHAIYQGMLELIQDQALTTALGDQGWIDVNKMSVHEMANQFAAIYQSMLETV
jgi:glycosyltransferase involved in cell wall biosynthesis